VLRSESLLHTVLEGRMEGMITRWRQSAMMIDWMKLNNVGIWTYKEKTLRQRRLALLVAWTYLTRQSTREWRFTIMKQQRT